MKHLLVILFIAITCQNVKAQSDTNHGRIHNPAIMTLIPVNNEIVMHYVGALDNKEKPAIASYITIKDVVNQWATTIQKLVSDSLINDSDYVVYIKPYNTSNAEDITNLIQCIKKHGLYIYSIVDLLKEEEIQVNKKLQFKQHE